MVQTRSAAKTIESGQAHSNDGVLPTENGAPPDPPPAKKRRRRQDVAAPKKRRRGKPGEICQLNLDVLFLIAAYIHPIDLLNLARTCKSLRVLLMDKSSAFVWRSARRQVKGLPDCPADLTEPEYANLVFYARCHGCGKYAKTVFWQMRRRYCLKCRVGRFCSYSSCHEIIRKNNVLAMECFTIEGVTTVWVDTEQMDSFMDEYKRTSDKKQFLSDRQEQLVAIHRHAGECEVWQLGLAAERKDELEMRRRERVTSIFERLKQHGYDPEVVHFGRYEIKKSRKSLFRTSKPLTDKEWDRIWPEWLEIMNNFRSRRLENVYQSRRITLTRDYDAYARRPSPNTPVFDLFPHVADTARFPPFRNIIRAPEGSEMNSELFESAFAELPALVDEWRKKLDAEIAELIKIPSHLSTQDASDVASRSITTHTESSQATTDKLHLACALFYGGCEGIFTHPEVFSTAMRHHSYPIYGEDGVERTGSIRDRFGIRFVEEAPYIVHACGLDPNVATLEDMDRRNARLKCLSCQTACIRSWRDALYHAHFNHKRNPVLPSEFPRWQIVSDEHMDAIHAAELSVKKELTPQWTRCLLCRPRVGDATWHCVTMDHVKYCHNIEEGDIKRGVHWVPLGMYEVCSVEMVEEGGQVTFKEPRYEVFR